MLSTVWPVFPNASTYSMGQGVDTPTTQGSNACETAVIILETVDPTRKDSTGIAKMRARTLLRVCASRSGRYEMTPFERASLMASIKDWGVPKGFSVPEKSIHEISPRTS